MQELGLDRDEWRDKRQTQGERVGQQNPTLEVQNRAISQLPLAQKVLGFLTQRWADELSELQPCRLAPLHRSLLCLWRLVPGELHSEFADIGKKKIGSLFLFLLPLLSTSPSNYLIERGKSLQSIPREKVQGEGLFMYLDFTKNLLPQPHWTWQRKLCHHWRTGLQSNLCQLGPDQKDISWAFK